jgi:Lrp/AsnC family transcriptional regulator, leucine-responsive regulatory protein
LPEVQQCYDVTGAADFIITAASMEEYPELSHRQFLDNPNVKHFSTNVAMNRVKVSLGVPVDHSR